MAKYTKAQRQRNLRDKRKPIIDSIKVTRGCADCGYSLAPEALHFDHRDPKDKLFNVSDFTNRSWDGILLEIAKCDVRCANCHAIRTVRMGHHL